VAAVTYGKNCYVSSGTVDSTTGDRTWEFCKFIVASLKAMATAPWVTRGSSCDGSLGTAFSATPDGVDRWAGKSIGQAAFNVGIRTVWHVLENTVTGLQVCIVYGAVNSQSSAVVFSLNKFETGGAWRGGGSSANVRPTDTVSSPAAGREITHVNNAPAVSGTGVPQVFRFNCLNRDDGKGFYAYYFPDSGATSITFSLVYGCFPVTAPQTEDNPYLLLATSYGSLTSPSISSTPGSLPSAYTQPNLIGRKGAAGTLITYYLLQPSSVPSNFLFGTTQVNDLDPVLAAYPMFPGVAWSDMPAGGAHFRAGLPDLYQADTALSPDLNTWNSKAHIQIGFLAFPYDTTQPTPRGIDRPGFLFSIDGDLQEDVTYTPDHRPFNSGLEVI
jgi:hypothetical protein